MAKGQPLGSDQSTAQRGPWHWMRAMTLSISTPGGGALTRVLLLAFDPAGLPQSAQGFLEPHCKAMQKRLFQQAATEVYVFHVQRRALDQCIPYIYSCTVLPVARPCLQVRAGGPKRRPSAQVTYHAASSKKTWTDNWGDGGCRSCIAGSVPLPPSWLGIAFMTIGKVLRTE